MTPGESPEDTLPEPAETPVRAVVPEGGKGTRPARPWRILLVFVLVLIWVAAYAMMGGDEMTPEPRAAYCRTAGEIEVLTEEELLVYQDPPGEGQGPDDVIREQFRQTAARMLLLYVRLGELAPDDLSDDIEEVATEYQEAVRSRDPSVARALRNSDASRRVDAFTEQTC
jgi:hypothetical protein